MSELRCDWACGPLVQGRRVGSQGLTKEGELCLLSLTERRLSRSQVPGGSGFEMWAVNPSSIPPGAGKTATELKLSSHDNQSNEQPQP